MKEDETLSWRALFVARRLAREKAAVHKINAVYWGHHYSGGTPMLECFFTKEDRSAWVDKALGNRTGISASVARWHEQGQIDAALYRLTSRVQGRASLLPTPEETTTADQKTARQKDTNPKDAVGVRKVPVSVIPAPVIGEVGLAILEGARKYGRHNWRAAGVRASVYYDAVVARHLAAWWEGQDIDAGSGLSHVTKAIAGLVILRDSMMQGNWVDDRPIPAKNQNWVDDLNKLAGDIVDRYPSPKPAFTADWGKP